MIEGHSIQEAYVTHSSHGKWIAAKNKLKHIAIKTEHLFFFYTKLNNVSVEISVIVEFQHRIKIMFFQFLKTIYEKDIIAIMNRY